MSAASSAGAGAAHRAHRVLVFTTPSCPWCNRAKAYLRQRRVPFPGGGRPPAAAGAPELAPPPGARGGAGEGGAGAGVAGVPAAGTVTMLLALPDGTAPAPAASPASRKIHLVNKAVRRTCIGTKINSENPLQQHPTILEYTY